MTTPGSLRRRLSPRRRSKGLDGILVSVDLSAQLLATAPILVPVGASWRFRLNRLGDTGSPPH